jgi:hypothetical protein
MIVAKKETDPSFFEATTYPVSSDVTTSGSSDVTSFGSSDVTSSDSSDITSADSCDVTSAAELHFHELTSLLRQEFPVPVARSLSQLLNILQDCSSPSKQQAKKIYIENTI